MACEEVGEFLVCPKPQLDGGTVWWDVGGGTVWSIPAGSVAEWLTVLVAVAAIATAWKASSRSHALQESLNQLEQQRENRTQDELKRRAEADERAFQADSVAAWIVVSDLARTVQRGAWKTHLKREVHVRNGSQLPLYGAKLIVQDWQEQSRGYRWLGMVPPGDWDHPLPEVDFSTIPVNDPDSDEIVEVPESWSDMSIAIEFVDTSGIRWVRHGTGELQRKGRWSRRA